MRLPERLKAFISLTEYSVSLIGKEKISSYQFFKTVIPNKEPQITEIIAS